MCETFIIRQEVEECLSDILPGQRLSVLQPLQQRPDGVILSLSVYGSNPVPLRKLALTQEVQNVTVLRKNKHTHVHDDSTNTHCCVPHSAVNMD